MRILGRIEKALLCVVGGFGFMLVATTFAPGMQTAVAGVACPGWAEDAYVVRYPHVEEPVGMVRNTPLVCVAGERAELASHARVLPALAGLGIGVTAAAVVGLSAVRVVVSRLRSATYSPTYGAPMTTAPPAPRTVGAFEAVRWLPLLIGTPMVFLTCYGAYWWLAVDTPYRKTACRSSSGSPATCYDGESVYRLLTIIFGALALVALTVWVGAVLHAITSGITYRRVWASGVRARARLVESSPTGTRIRGRRVHRFTYEVDAPDGGSFRFTERGFDTPAGVDGGTTDVVYDPGNRKHAFTLALDTRTHVR